MKTSVLGVLMVLLAGGLWGAEDHQRLAATLPESHSVALAGGFSLLELSGHGTQTQGRWELSYQFRDVLAVSVNLPLEVHPKVLTWTARYLGTQANWRTRMSLAWIVPGGYEWSTGASVILDPVVLSGDFRWSDTGGRADFGLVTTATEVLNEAVSWSFSAMPSGHREGSRLSWSLGFQVQVSWSSGDWSVSTSTTYSSLVLATEAGVGWRRGW